MQNKNFAISTVRGLAIALVVYGHVIQRSMAVKGEDFFLNPAFKVIYMFHMPLFFFISGYLLAFSLSRRSVHEAFQIRCRTLLGPYLSWSILGVFSLYIVNSIDGKSGAVNLLWDLFNQMLFNPMIWFLFTLFV